jgi:hypothetical protein
MMFGLRTSSCQKWPSALPSIRQPERINPQQNSSFARGSFGREFSLQQAARLEEDLDLAERVEAFVGWFGRLQDTLGIV